MATTYEIRGPRFEIGIDEDAYPMLLKQSQRPPARLYGIGDPQVLCNPGVAVIGARKASPYGLAMARRFALVAARRGATIVSGGARGCDQVAHRAALDMGAPTVVVLGGGADVVYPKSGHKLFQEVVDNGGVIISENPWGTAPLPALFPQRNRIIAGLSLLLVIAEAGLPSGTFSTADAALSLGRDVAVVPGAVTSPYSRGSNELLHQGAFALVDDKRMEDALNAAFALEPLSLMEGGPTDAMERSERAWREFLDKDDVLRALSADSYGPDELTAYFGFSAAELLKRLSQYEMQGLVERGRDGRYHAVKPEGFQAK